MSLDIFGILTISPGSEALKGILSQFSPASEVYSRIAGFPTIHPSFPLKLMELNLQLKSSSSAEGIDRPIQVIPPSFVSIIVCLVPRRKPEVYKVVTNCEFFYFPICNVVQNKTFVTKQKWVKHGRIHTKKRKCWNKINISIKKKTIHFYFK